MAFTLYSLLQAALLCVNAIAVLHEERFLKNIGWGTDQGIGGFGEEPGIKSQLTNLIRSVRTVMRVDANGMISDIIRFAIDNSKLNCNCIAFIIWMKINGGNGDSEEELPAEVITSVFIGVYVS
ncbi:hypothetical protein HPG69_003743 [Diceros bicornis minor]|uniref:Immediate early response 3-interacting protein 1 n=1 Tax=Diceros bicornis minor TaxID=77932 RepID=A0A7J7ETG2_DICBM|nr:hypothetical protein HPG69_003743 [Diceros bicornis minor]